MTSENDFRSVSAFSLDAQTLDNGRETHQLITLGERHGWDLNVLGHAPMPSAPIHLDEWLLVPAQLDSSDVPARAINRISAIYAAGLRPQGFVIIHEAPKVLPSPSKVDNEPEQIPDFVRHSGGALEVAGQVASVVARLAATMGVALPVALLTLALLIDPILVVVTEDDYWIEIDRWWA